MSMDWEKQRKAGKHMTIGMAVFQIVFAVIWCLLVAAMRVWIMLLFGLVFLIAAIYRLVILLQMTREDKKPPRPRDPWEQPRQNPPEASGSFCPYCGAAVEGKFAYCPSCGRKLR